jgi:hypothetical protein
MTSNLCYRAESRQYALGPWVTNSGANKRHSEGSVWHITEEESDRIYQAVSK